ncbi:HNH endonuclease [Streptomyces lydicus]|uniref:HNH endonuclease n=1 Tax=Streptomyces lydicus TaxID=47763 RepID=UPI003692E553
MLLQSQAGSEMRIERLDASDQLAIHAEVIAVAQPLTFDRCPICLTPEPFSKEHVPPEALGGAVMTSTCHRCNNQFGSLLESALIDWWEDAIGSVSFSHADVPGARRTARVLQRQTDSGEFVLLLDRGRMDPAITERMIAEAVIEMAYSPPDPRRYRLAALKSAYLGACLLLKSIPETPEAVAIRDELMSVRDLPRRQRPAISRLCAELSLAKSQGPAAPGEIALVRTRPADGSAPELAISLARTLLVAWPIGDCSDGPFGHIGP